MRYATPVKSICCIKANADEGLDRLVEDREPMSSTQNGEACAVLCCRTCRPTTTPGSRLHF